MSWTTQESVDARRKVYTLTFPTDLTEDRVKAWIHSISGALKGRAFGFLPVSSIVFETWATDQGITHRLLTPPSEAAFIVQHLESMIPGVHVDEDHDRPQLHWDEVTELGMTRPQFQLNIPNGTDFAHSILTSVQALEGDQTVLLQWVITHNPPQEAPLLQRASEGQLKDLHQKRESDNFLAIGRIAVKGREGQSNQLTRDALMALSNTHTAYTRLARRTYTTLGAVENVNAARTPRRLPAQLSTPELAALISWAIGTPYIAGLPKSRTRHMHVNNSVPSGGIGATVIGQSTVKKNPRDIAISPIDRMTHIHVMGPIGSGKTALLTNLAEQDMKAGNGLVLIETKGDLFHTILERVPYERWKDVIVWDLDDTYPVGFNILKQGSSKAAVDELNNLITALYPESGPLTTGPLYHGLHALADADGGTFIDLETLILPTTDEERRWRADLVKNIKDRAIRKYWENALKKKDAIESREAEPLKRRLWQFTSRSEIRNSLGQSQSSFTMDEVVRDGKILLINLNGTRIGSGAANVMGALILSSLWNSVRRVPHETPIILYMDEFQNFVTMPTNPSEMLAQSRSFGLGMVLAHQHTGQLNRDLRDAVLANARSKIVFQTTSTDARIMAAEFGAQIKPDDFMNLERREAIARVATATGVSQPFTMRTKDMTPPSANPRLIREQSRAKYGRPVEVVEAEIEQRWSAATGPDERPAVGEMEWKR